MCIKAAREKSSVQGTQSFLACHWGWDLMKKRHWSISLSPGQGRLSIFKGLRNGCGPELLGMALSAVGRLQASVSQRLSV